MVSQQQPCQVTRNHDTIGAHLEGLAEGGGRKGDGTFHQNHASNSAGSTAASLEVVGRERLGQAQNSCQRRRTDLASISSISDIEEECSGCANLLAVVTRARVHSKAAASTGSRWKRAGGEEV
ncbi:hypothetical protein R1sor_006553 [Riccia sorocarpa]|uniref:Uncharacterized protein n=1 Tax=Riccia sorocarpa TaxID=122646 RepID=A0ABD3HQR8_9MARC